MLFQAQLKCQNKLEERRRRRRERQREMGGGKGGWTSVLSNI